MGKLEDIVLQMEGEGLSLDESLQKYEEGIKLYRECRKIIEQAELKVERIQREIEKEGERENELS